MVDLGGVFDAHVANEFVTTDLVATMETMTDHPSVTHVPTMTGGTGREAVARFYADSFIGHWPKDTTITPVSRTVGIDQVVDELVMGFTHDIVMDAFLPGLAPTGRAVRIGVVVVVGFRDGLVHFERIYWDQASVLVQLGLLEVDSLPITGVAQTDKILDPSLPGNLLPRCGVP